MATRTIARIDGGPLEGTTGVVYGQGPLGLMTALALARNGAEVETFAASPIEEGVGFVHAAGLFEPVATSDKRQKPWLQKGLEFCEWAKDDPDWGLEPRRVLFMSDDSELVRQEWMTALPSYRPANEDELVGRRRHGAWFDTFVIEPGIAITALRRELKALGVRGRPASVPSVKRAADHAAREKADFFVLALGLGLASLPDIEEVADRNAGLSAGLGLTVRMPIEAVGIDHVIMDADDLGYLIPQRTTVVCGGTNVLAAFDDPAVVENQPELAEELEAEVRRKVSALWPRSADVSGIVRLGARPLRHEVLTAYTDKFSIPGIVLGGAGGSGWTFSIGVADDSCAFLADSLGKEGTTHALVSDVGSDLPDDQVDGQAA